MPATRNSKSSRASKKAPGRTSTAGSGIGWIPAVPVFVFLLTLGALFAWFCSAKGWTLYWGDAEAHLNIARSVFDSRTPGYDQLGTVWLPLPHALMLAFARVDSLWRTGLAGVIGNVICFALAGTALWATARRLFDSAAAGWTAALLFAFNPNVLYLQSIPMTESVLLATVSGLVYFVVAFTQSGSLGAVAGAGLCSAAACLTRYEGWFLIPFVCLVLVLAGGQKRWIAATLFGAIASTAPLYWMAHNWWLTSNALDFYNGPYSAKAIYDRGHPPGSTPYPTIGNWSLAVLYYRTAVELFANSVLFWLGLGGLAAALWKRAWWALAILSAIPFFYIMSLHSSGSGTELFVPTLWPKSYYNTRYATGTFPLLILGAASLAALLPGRARPFVAAAIVIAAAVPWLSYPRPDNWVTWKESQVNSETRRAWTAETAEFLRANYKPGDRVFTSFGDLTAAFREAGIPLRQTLHEGNGPAFLGALQRPDLFLHTEWAVAIAASPLADAMMKVNTSYQVVRTVYVRGGPVIEIYRRTHDLHPIHEGARSAQ